MKTAVEIVNEDECYRDAEVYVVDETTGAEWKFRIYLDKEFERIVECDPMYSPTQEDCFDETDLPVPPAVREAVSAAMPRVQALLKGESK